jgi:uncharacterized protein YijF (DUF1287 family)
MKKEETNLHGGRAHYSSSNLEEKLSSAALSIIDPMVVYDPSYISIRYPNGDVPATKGVCTDVIIRSYRKLLSIYKKEVHEDMKTNLPNIPI